MLKVVSTELIPGSFELIYRLYTVEQQIGSNLDPSGSESSNQPSLLAGLMMIVDGFRDPLTNRGLLSPSLTILRV